MALRGPIDAAGLRRTDENLPRNGREFSGVRGPVGAGLLSQTCGAAGSKVFAFAGPLLDQRERPARLFDEVLVQLRELEAHLGVVDLFGQGLEVREGARAIAPRLGDLGPGAQGERTFGTRRRRVG